MIGFLVATLLMSGAGIASPTPWQDLGLPPGAVEGYAPGADRLGLLGSFWGPDEPSLGIWRHRLDLNAWEPVGLEGRSVNSIRVTGSTSDTILASCYSATPDTLFYFSPDGGLTWIGKPALQETISVLGADRRRAGIIYGLQHFEWIHRSTDLGETWWAWQAGSNHWWHAVEPIPADDRIAFALYTGIDLSVMRTANGDVRDPSMGAGADLHRWFGVGDVPPRGIPLRRSGGDVGGDLGWAAPSPSRVRHEADIGPG